MTTAQPGQEQMMVELTLEMIQAGARAFNRQHGDCCYPVAMDAEAEAAAIKIYGEMVRADTRPTADLGEDGELIERLRVHARCASDVHRLMAEAKTDRQVDGGSYDWIAPEQTDEWQAADRIEQLRKALEGMVRIADWGAEDSEEYAQARALLSRSGDD